MDAEEMARLQRLMTTQLEACEQMLRGMARLVERVERLEAHARTAGDAIQEGARLLAEIATADADAARLMAAMDARLATLEETARKLDHANWLQGR